LETGVNLASRFCGPALRFDPLRKMTAKAHKLWSFGTPHREMHTQVASLIGPQGNDQDFDQRVRFISPLATGSCDNCHGVAALQRLLAFL
jgi:hypothetical protein